ncbi:MAG TPA: leucyl/phenylalanyl-tRNA--protein transferase [Acidimicrobiales bacterium]|nr:leucyl/phenylalanyl-tRNA--protein transferase [Acidimicrobiales bacterium]
MPAEPSPGRWAFPPVDGADDDGLVGVGADLEPGTLLSAYRHGVFPMPVGRGRHLGWWSPDPRAILPLDALRVSRSLRRSLRRYEIRVDTVFERVVEACADPRRPHGWISPEIRVAYGRLHEFGWAHSVEAWADEGRGCPTLAGGLYGVAIGGLFAGESMFHRRTDASKAALVALVEHLTAAGAQGRLLDVQWQTPHLATLGAVEIPRREYLRRLSVALERPLPPVFGR